MRFNKTIDNVFIPFPLFYYSEYWKFSLEKLNKISKEGLDLIHSGFFYDYDLDIILVFLSPERGYNFPFLKNKFVELLEERNLNCSSSNFKITSKLEEFLIHLFIFLNEKSKNLEMKYFLYSFSFVRFTNNFSNEYFNFVFLNQALSFGCLLSERSKRKTLIAIDNFFNYNLTFLNY